MKKFIAVLALSASLLPFAAFADEVAVPSNGDPGAVTQGWGLTGHQTPVMAAGTSVTDEGGIVFHCPEQEKMGCSNIFGTTYYHNYMVALVTSLRAANNTGFSSLQGWFNLVK